MKMSGEAKTKLGIVAACVAAAVTLSCVFAFSAPANHLKAAVAFPTEDSELALVWKDGESDFVTRLFSQPMDSDRSDREVNELILSYDSPQEVEADPDVDVVTVNNPRANEAILRKVYPQTEENGETVLHVVTIFGDGAVRNLPLSDDLQVWTQTDDLFIPRALIQPEEEELWEQMGFPNVVE